MKDFKVRLEVSRVDELVKQYSLNNQYEVLQAVLNDLEVMKNKVEALENEKLASIDGLLTDNTKALINEAVEASTFSKKDIVNTGIQHKASYVITAAKKIKGKSTENLSSKRAGTAHIRIENFINEVKQVNEGLPKGEQMAITQTLINKGSAENNIEGLNPNRNALKRYLANNMESIVKYNLRLGTDVFEGTVKYMSGDKKVAMIEIAKQFGYEG